ncbi:MAG: flagellar brake protein [Oscillospiraceae bacterium]|jgi:c-di-GMP-binding flagellar brake protein YcgR|nr:flagellar brake protein [Oscillospiraceae bacterium]
MAELTVGMKLDVFVEPEKEGGERVKLLATLEGFTEGTRLLITAPMQGMMIYPLQINQKLDLQCYVKSAIISFEGVVLQRLNKGSLSYVLLNRVGEFKRTQRRQDFRLECLLDGRIVYTDAESGETVKMPVIVSDISGGGTSVVSKTRFNTGDRLTVQLPIGDKMANITYQCEVRRCFEDHDSVLPMKYHVGLRFLFKDEREKDFLISRIFVMERERRKLNK